MKKTMIAIFMLACCQLALRADFVTTTTSAYNIDPSNGAKMSVTGNVYTSYDGVTQFLVKNSGKTYKITPVNNLNEPTTNIIAYNPGQLSSGRVNASDFRYSLDNTTFYDRNAFNAVWGDDTVMKADGATTTDSDGNLSELTTTLLYHQAYPNSTELAQTIDKNSPYYTDYDYAKGIQNGTIVNQIGRTGVGIFQSMETNTVIFTYYTPIYGTITSTFKTDTQGPLGTVMLDGTATNTSIGYNSIFKTAIAEVTDIDDDDNSYNYYTSCVVYDEPIDGTALGYTSLGSYTNDYGTYYVLGQSTTDQNKYNSANSIIDGTTVAYS